MTLCLRLIRKHLRLEDPEVIEAAYDDSATLTYPYFTERQFQVALDLMSKSLLTRSFRSASHAGAVESLLHFTPSVWQSKHALTREGRMSVLDNIRALNHFGLEVANLEKSGKFYTEVLEAQVLKRVEIGRASCRERVYVLV